MKAIKLLNSAMMPQEGHYSLKRITREEFVEEIRTNVIISYIGYKDTADFIEKISGVEIDVNRNPTELRDTDTFLVIKLKYRVPNPAEKGKYVPTDEDYEFFICHYSKEAPKQSPWATY